MCGEGETLKPHRNEFLVTYMGSYTLYVDGRPYMALNQLKQQAIFGPAQAAFSSM
jgi:hypothetical protein